MMSDLATIEPVSLKMMYEFLIVCDHMVDISVGITEHATRATFTYKGFAARTIIG
jgi:hypothetical protein